MIFTPYKDELTIINRIQKVRNTDYVLLRLTSTMIGKNNLDANEYFREMLLNHNIVNYEMLENGGSNGIDFSSILILPNSVQSVKLKFYRVNNARGDRRFSIETIKRKSQNGILNEGDLLYISVYMDEYDQPKIFIINLTHKSTRHFPACSHNFPKAGEARFQGLSRLFCLLGKFPYLGESRRILMAVSSKTSSKTRFCYAATRRISSAAVQPSIWA